MNENFQIQSKDSPFYKVLQMVMMTTTVMIVAQLDNGQLDIYNEVIYKQIM